jgi:hypothetical protein
MREAHHNFVENVKAIIGLTVFAIFAIFVLSACGPFIDTKHGIVSGGFMSTTQAFSGKMKALDGSSAVWSITGTDSTSVANNALGTLSTVSAGNNMVKSLESNNGVKNTAAKEATKQQGQALNAASTDLQTTTGAATKQAAINAGLVPKQ